MTKDWLIDSSFRNSIGARASALTYVPDGCIWSIRFSVILYLRLEESDITTAGRIVLVTAGVKIWF